MMIISHWLSEENMKIFTSGLIIKIEWNLIGKKWHNFFGDSHMIMLTQKQTEKKSYDTFDMIIMLLSSFLSLNS